MRMQRMGLPALLSSLLAANPAVADDKADHIWTGGPILTMNDAAMRAEAVAEKAGKIIAVGSKAAVMALKGDKTKVVDLGGRAMIPGFFDAHGHVLMPISWPRLSVMSRTLLR